MKKIIFIFSLLLFAATATQSQTAKGLVRIASFTIKPSNGNGYEVRVALKYRFQLCEGSVTLDGFRIAHEPLAYWYNGKRYDQSAVECQFKAAEDDLYRITADIYNDFSGMRIGSGKWVWTNLPDWGGCLGDYGDGGFEYNTAGVLGNVQEHLKEILPFLYLRNIKLKDEPQRNYEIEECILNKKEEPRKVADNSEEISIGE